MMKSGSSKKHPTKHCRVCYPKRKDTRMCCTGCPDSLGLCSVEHLKIFIVILLNKHCNLLSKQYIVIFFIILLTNILHRIFTNIKIYKILV